MRLFGLLSIPATRNVREPFPFQELLPLKLKSSVSGKGEKSSDVACLQEMTILFACLKKNDFNQTPCSSEIQTFGKCYTSFMVKKREKNEMEKKGILQPGERKLSYKQINHLLKFFPT